MSSSATLEDLTGNLLLTNLLLVEREINDAPPSFMTLDDEEAVKAWDAVRSEPKPRNLVNLSEDGWRRFVEGACDVHKARAGTRRGFSCFLLYVESAVHSGSGVVRTAVPDSGVARLLGFPYTVSPGERAVVDGVREDGIEISPPLRRMAKPLESFGHGPVSQAQDSSIVYSPRLGFDRDVREFDIAAGLMSVLTVRIPYDAEKPLLGFLVLGAVHPNAFGEPVQSGQNLSVCPERRAYLQKLLEACGVVLNLEAIPQRWASQGAEERAKLSVAAGRLKHDAALTKQDLEVAATRVGLLSEKAPDPKHQALLKWVTRRMRICGARTLNQASLFVHAVARESHNIPVKEFDDLVNLLQEDIREQAPDRFVASYEDTSSLTTIPELLQATAVELIRNAELHRDNAADGFRLKVTLGGTSDDAVLTIHSEPHVKEKVDRFDRSWREPLDSAPVKGIPLMRRVAKELGWLLKHHSQGSQVTVSVAFSIPE